jgi:hypothetical protein
MIGSIFFEGKAKKLRESNLSQARAKAKMALEAVSSGASHVETMKP